MFAFSQIEPQTTGRISKWDVPLNRWLGVKFGEGYDATVGRAWERALDGWFAEGDMLSPEEANERYKLPTLKFDEPVRDQEAWHRYQRKREELSRQAYLEAASHSAFSGKAIAGFGAQLLGGLFHPIDAGLIFLPIVGSAERAAMAAKSGAGGLRQAFARGLITQEQINVISRYPKFTAAVVEGTIGQAVVEIPVYAQKRRDSSIYGIEDAIINVALGGAFAGGIHAAAKGLSRALEAAGVAHSRLTPETKSLLQREAVQAFVEGREISVRDAVELDEVAIRSKILFDEAQARQEAESDVPGVKPFDPEWRVTVQEPQKLSETAEVPGYTQIDILENGKNVRSTNIETLRKEGFAVPDLRGLPQGQYKLGEAVEIVNGSAVKDIEAKMGMERQRRVEEVIARKKQEFEAVKEQKVTAARAAEISRQQAEGKILSDEQIEAYKADPTDENAGKFLDEDISTLEQDLKADNDRRLAELDEDEAAQASLKEELEEELAALEEKTYQPRDKAIQAAIPCAMETLVQ